MSECLVEHKGRITNPLPSRRYLEMPGENEEAEIDVTDTQEKYIKQEDNGDTANKDDSMLYALATAAASRTTSSANTSVKKEAGPKSSPGGRGSPRSPMKLEKRSPSPQYNYSGATSSFRPYHQDTKTKSASPDNHMSAHQHKFTLPAQDTESSLAGKPGSQLHLMEAMMQRQRQLYEEYGQNSWMKMQRNDSNCLSKSKAKRYRWCVQKQQDSESANESLMATAGNQSSNDYSFPSNKKRLSMKRPGNNNPMHDKLYGTVFTGASKFRCRDCGKSFTTLVDLTLHMSNTGHYRDQNIDEVKGCGDDHASKFAKAKKRSVMEMEEKESAEKVLKCLGCGHSFDSLQDLTVHMIKTKHYEDVPSLRLYSQKSDYCQTANGISQPITDEKSSSQRISSTLTGGEYASHIAPDSTTFPLSNHEQPNLNFLNSGSIPPTFGGQHNFANMLSMAALRLLGFPPYFMQMPFPNAMGGYDMASAAYAAAAARLFLSSPWLSQMPGIGGGSVFPPFLNSHAHLPPSLLPQSRQQSPTAGDILPVFSSAHSASSTHRPLHQSSPNGSHHSGGNQRDSDDTHGVKSHILRCVQCGESFSSLQKMTDHMRETTHFPIAMTPPSDEASNYRRASRCSSSTDSVVRGSPQPKTSPQHSAHTPTSSPLEQLAKLASGKSLGESNKTSFQRSKPDHESVSKSRSPTLATSPMKPRPPSNHSLSGECYVCPDSPRKSSETALTGFDFIKSLESTIQSAISRVNQPSTSPVQFKQGQNSVRSEKPRFQKSKKHHILDSFLPNTTRVHRKSLPNNCGNNIIPSVNEKAKAPERPASDGEEYYRKEKGEEVPAKEPANRKQSSVSPPLDLSKPSKVENETSVTENHEAEKSDTSYKNPLQCIKDDMKSLFESNARKRWENKQRSVSPPLLKRARTEPEGSPMEQPIQKPFVREYKAEPSSPNPLKEMQKIVNSTDMSIKDVRNAFPGSKMNGQKRKLEADDTKNERQSKSYKASSVLSDLVRHDDDDPVPSIDPLTQMENLVNLKIGRNIEKKSNAVQKNSHFSKSYFSLMPDSPNASQNGTNPMSALLNLFKANSSTNQDPATTQKDGLKKDTPNGCHSNGVALNGTDETERFKEKMAEFFRTMMSQNHKETNGKSHREPSISPTNHDNHDHTSSPKDDCDLNNLTTTQQIHLQALVASHIEDGWNDINIPDVDVEKLSDEIGLSSQTIKEWICSTVNGLREKNQCDFIYPQESDSSILFRCTSCPAESAQGLSARDFLHHLSTHIIENPESNSPKLNCGDRKDEKRLKKDWEMFYRGAMHFKSLKASDGSSPTFSLTAHVSEAGTESGYANSNLASEQRKHVDVIDDSPIKVSG